MKYFIKNGRVFALDSDGSQDHLIEPGMAPASREMVQAITNPPLNQEALALRYAEIVQRHLDTVAQSRRFFNMESASTYATSTVPSFQADAVALIAWRDQVWVTCYGILDEVQAGTRAQPTTAELIAALPEMVWPT